VGSQDQGLSLQQRPVAHGRQVDPSASVDLRLQGFLPPLADVVAGVEETRDVPGNRDTAAVSRRILLPMTDALESLATLLRLRGHEVFSAPNGAIALETAVRHMPEVALLDIGMPLLDGYEVARRIRTQDWGRAVSLVALTSWGQESDRRRSQEADSIRTW
jgi:two-component system, chemotaxis family, CheB/CheR fusion protein